MIFKKYPFSLGLKVALFWSLYVTFRNLIKANYDVHQLPIILFSTLMIFVSTILIWFIVFATMPPLNEINGFYKPRSILLTLTYCLLLFLPFVGLGYYFERNAQSLTVFNEILNIYLITMLLEFCLVMTFKYIQDSRQIAKDSLEEAYSAQIAHTKAHFDILKQQVNPHFLFNALSTLKSLIRMRDPHAEEFVMSLSDVYRKLLTRRDKDLISLGDEMEMVTSFLFMQKLRFENNLQTDIRIEPEYLDFWIPPFALQVLIENTIKHNTISRRRPLSIRLFVENHKIVIENTLQPKKINEESTGWGLSSLSERYAFFTTKLIDIQQTETVFRVALPLLTKG